MSHKKTGGNNYKLMMNVLLCGDLVSNRIHQYKKSMTSSMYYSLACLLKKT